MNSPATRQELQNALDRTRSSIMSSMMSKGDLQTVAGQIRAGILNDLNSLHAENQMAMKQAVNGRAQLMQRMGAVETSLARIEQALHALMIEHSKTSMTVGKMQTDNGGYLFQRI